MKLFCYFGFHCWHTSANGMVRYCTNCSQWLLQVNSPYDPIQRWSYATIDEVQDTVDKWRAKGVN